MKRTCSWMLIGFAATSAVVLWSADGEKPDEKIQQVLKRHPEADLNKDGVLTRDEMAAFRKRTVPAKPTFANVKYGPHERNVLDFWRAQTAIPAPVVVFIHGGGFVAGDKSGIGAAFVERALQEGMSVAAINYRFADGKDVLFPAPQKDGARAIQFLRSKAQEWNIDTRKIAAFGGSAGAGISMWLGYHDDLADPSSDDPVERQSSRVAAIGSMGGQTSYDPIWIKENIGGRAWEHPSIFKVYNIRTPEEALNPTSEVRKLYDEASAVTHLTKDDPPIFMIFSEPDIDPPAGCRPGEFIHHPRFAKALIPKLNALGIAHVYAHTSDAAGRDLHAEMLAFFQREFDKIEGQ